MQQVEKNRDDFKELAETIVAVIVLVRDEIVARPDGSKSPSRFDELCKDFNECDPSFLT
jgi:hypothetical protein